MAADDTQQQAGDTLIAPGDVDTANVQLVDVRTDEEHAASRIPDTRHIPLDRLHVEAGSLDRERAVVFYCRSGDRSAAAATALRASGWDAFSVEGGLVAWAAQGLPVEPEGAEVPERSNLPPA